MREQAVTAGQIDDPAAAKEATDAARRFPRLVQLFARQAAGVAHRAGESVEEGVVREATEVAVGEAALRRWREHATAWRDARADATPASALRERPAAAPRGEPGDTAGSSGQDLIRRRIAASPVRPSPTSRRVDGVGIFAEEVNEPFTLPLAPQESQV